MTLKSTLVHGITCNLEQKTFEMNFYMVKLFFSHLLLIADALNYENIPDIFTTMALVPQLIWHFNIWYTFLQLWLKMRHS